jgi:hypothetical protein
LVLSVLSFQNDVLSTWPIAKKGRILAHGFVALELELFAEGGVGFAGGILGVNCELEFARAAADLGALVFQAGVHVGVRGLAGSSGSETKAGRVGKTFFQSASRTVRSLFCDSKASSSGDEELSLVDRALRRAMSETLLPEENIARRSARSTFERRSAR